MMCIYAIKNKLDNKMYIGMTNNFQKRINHHFYELKNNKHHSLKLQRAYNKYGKDNFEVLVLEEVETMQGLEIKEKEYIKEYNSYLKGYNCSEGGEKLPDYKQPETTRQALLKRNKGNKYGLGMHMSEESKQKISLANKGEGNGFYGKKHTKKTRNSMSEKSKAYWQKNKEKMVAKLTEVNRKPYRRKQVSEQWSGENNINSKLKLKDVIAIRKRYKNGEKIINIYEDYKDKMSLSGFKKIIYKETWKNA